MRRTFTAPILKLLALWFLVPVSGTAQERPPASVHWAYAAYFGTGWYRVSDDRDVFVVRMTARWNWSDASMSDSGERNFGYDFKLSVSIGLDQFDFDDPFGHTQNNQNKTLCHWHIGYSFFESLFEE